MEERRGEDLRETRAAGGGWRRLAHAVPSSGPAGCRRHRRRADAHVLSNRLAGGPTWTRNWKPRAPAGRGRVEYAGEIDEYDTDAGKRRSSSAAAQGSPPVRSRGGERRDDDARVAAATSDGTRAVNGEGSTPAVHALPRPRNSIVRGIAGLAWAFGHRADAAHVGWYVGKGGGLGIRKRVGYVRRRSSRRRSSAGRRGPGRQPPR